MIGKKLAGEPFYQPVPAAGFAGHLDHRQPAGRSLSGFLSGADFAAENPENQIGRPSAGRLIRQSLLVVQFVIAIGAIALTLLMNRQLDFIKNRDLGFTKDPVILVNVGDAESAQAQRRLQG